MKKKIILVLCLITVGCFNISGCGKGKEEAQTADMVSEVTDIQETPEEESAEPAEDVEASEKVSGEELQEKEPGEETESSADIQNQKGMEESKKNSAMPKETGEDNQEKKKTAASTAQNSTAATSKPQQTTAQAPASGSGTSSQAPASGSSTSSQGTQAHTCTWDSGKVTAAATCASEGTMTYTCTGCGRTRTESIPKTSNHNLVTESVAATCTEAAKTKTYCSVCGYVQSETSNGSPLGHDFQKRYWPSAPTCDVGGYYNIVCTICGEHNGAGDDPPTGHVLGHTEVVQQGNCWDETIVNEYCGVCGELMGQQHYIEPGAHEWITATGSELNLVTGEWEEVTRTFCKHCHMEKPN